MQGRPFLICIQVSTHWTLKLNLPLNYVTIDPHISNRSAMYRPIREFVYAEAVSFAGDISSLLVSYKPGSLCKKTTLLTHLRLIPDLRLWWLTDLPTDWDDYLINFSGKLNSFIDWLIDWLIDTFAISPALKGPDLWILRFLLTRGFLHG